MITHEQSGTIVLMSDCCSPTNLNPAAKPDGQCPLCGVEGRDLNEQTVKRLLRLDLSELRARPYLFCPNDRCAVVYFSADGASYATLTPLR